MENDEKVIALLIDAENVSPQYIKIILDEVSMYGTPAYKRIYGDWTTPAMASWKKILLEHSLTPIQQFSYTQGKNATDSAMIIDAMDILYADHVDGFCLVSSDSDFTRLASRLRESCMFVIGMGESKTPTAFKSACDTFKYLDVLMGIKNENARASKEKKKATQEKAERSEKAEKAEKAAEPSARSGKNAQPKKSTGKKNTKAEKAAAAVRAAETPSPVDEAADVLNAAIARHPAPEASAPPVLDEMANRIRFLAAQDETDLSSVFVPLEEIVEKIREIVEHDSDEDGYTPLSLVGVMLSRMYTDFDSRNYGFSKLHKLIDYTGAFETKYEQFENGGKSLVIRNKN